MSEHVVEPEVKVQYDKAVADYGELRARCLLALWRNKFEMGCRYSKAAEAYIRSWPPPVKNAPIAAQSEEDTGDVDGYGWREATFSYENGGDDGVTSPTSALSSSFSELDVDRRRGSAVRGRGAKKDNNRPRRREARARKDSYDDDIREEEGGGSSPQRDRFGRPIRGRGDKDAKKGNALRGRNVERAPKNGKTQSRGDPQTAERDTSKNSQSSSSGSYKWVQKQPNGKNASLTSVGGRSRGTKSEGVVSFVSGGTQNDPLAEGSDDEREGKGMDDGPSAAKSPHQKPMDTSSPTNSKSQPKKTRQSNSSRPNNRASSSTSSPNTSANDARSPREQNPVSLLNEYCQKAHPRLHLEFQRIEASNRNGKQSNQISFRVLINRRQMATARGITLKIAKRNAAANAIEVLERQNPSTRELLQTIRNKKPVVLSEENAVQRANVLELGDASKSKPIGRENKGRRIMERMGWRGGGLGRNERGLREVPTIILSPHNGTDGLGYVPPAHIREAQEFRGGAGARLMHFLSSDDMEIQFSNTLSKEERAVVHTLAEKYNLIHRSFGKGVERALIVKKRTHGRQRPPVGQLNRYY